MPHLPETASVLSFHRSAIATMEVAKQVDVKLGEHLACRPRSLSATDDAAAGCDDVDLVFDASGDPRAAGDDVSTIPKELSVYLRQLQVMLANEAAHMPSPHFIETTQQPHNGMLTSWRKSLTDWIIEVRHRQWAPHAVATVCVCPSVAL